MFSEEQVREASIEYFKGDTLAADVFVSKYALRDLEGRLYELTPADMHRRLAKEFARIEAKFPNPMSEQEILEMLSDFNDAGEPCAFGVTIPQGSPMSAIGNPFQVQSIGNCFVVQSPHDSYGGICYTDQRLAQIMKRRGGVGADLGTLRPKGAKVRNAARSSTGIVAWSERFSNTCREVGQEGRRGALMLSCPDNHPEVFDFVTMKRDRKKVTGANVSLRIHDDFMVAVKNDGDFELKFPVDSETPDISKKIRAKDLWDSIIESAWSSAEPGLLFWDTICRESPLDLYPGFRTISTNPCGEIPLSAEDSCRLITQNLWKAVRNPFTSEAFFDFEYYHEATYKAQRLMDDLIEIELEQIDKILAKIDSDPEPDEIKDVERTLWKKIRSNTVQGRRTGLGTTALGDVLAALNIRYGSPEAVDMTEKIYRAHALAAYESSIHMAEERGAFPMFDWELEKNHAFLQRIYEALPSHLQEKWRTVGRRNGALLTTAPTGSVSIEAQVSGGFEPVFMLWFVRRRKRNPSDSDFRVDFVDELGDEWQEYRVYHHGFALWKQVTGLTDDDVHLSPYYKATANDIDWPAKVAMQGAAQKWIDHAISNTLNLPKDVSKEVVAEVYFKAWEAGCKGITVYRDGSRSGVLVSESTVEVKDPWASVETLYATSKPPRLIETHAPQRPKEMPCDIHRTSIGKDQYMVLVGLLNGKPYEVFCGKSEMIEVPKRFKTGTLIKRGKRGGIAIYDLSIDVGGDEPLLFKDVVNLFDNPLYGSFTRTVSLALRHGVPVQYLCEQLRKDKHADLFSFSTVIARVLAKNYIRDGVSASGLVCESCAGTHVAYQEGCLTCLDCGSSKCG